MYFSPSRPLGPILSSDYRIFFGTIPGGMEMRNLKKKKKTEIFELMLGRKALFDILEPENSKIICTLRVFQRFT